MGAQKLGPRIAIVKNFAVTEAIWAIEMIVSFKRLILCSAPSAIIDVVDAVQNDSLPDPDLYDVIILTGGTYNLTLDKYEPWVQQELDWIQTMPQFAPATRLVGVCWGHQAVSRALGGAVEFVPPAQKHVVGRQCEQLYQQGQSLFGQEELRLIHFRARRVAKPGEGALVLAADNAILYYPERNILTLQGHPEFTSIVANDILDNDGGVFSKNMDEAEMMATRAAFSAANDGDTAFAVVMKWALKGLKQDIVRPN